MLLFSSIYSLTFKFSLLKLSSILFLSLLSFSFKLISLLLLISSLFLISSIISFKLFFDEFSFKEFLEEVLFNKSLFELLCELIKVDSSITVFESKMEVEFVIIFLVIEIEESFKPFFYFIIFFI